MSNYEHAIELMPSRNVDDKKRALHRAGKLAVGLKDVETADKHITELASMDFGYLDVAELLEKVRVLRESAVQ